MASALMHIAVANEVNKKLNMNSEILVGSIAPDLGKLVGQAKYIGHFSNESSDLPDLDKFLSNHDISVPYNMGYFIHLLTDKIWFDEYMPKHYNGQLLRLSTGKYVEMDFKSRLDLIYEDYTSLNEMLESHYFLDLDFLERDYNITTDILEVPAGDIDLLLNEVVKIYKLKITHPLNVFREDEVIEFIDKCVEECMYAISKQEEQTRL